MVRRRSRRHMSHTVGKVDSGLAVVVIVVSIIGIIGAIVAAVGSGKLYEQVGKGGLSPDRGERRAGAVGAAVGRGKLYGQGGKGGLSLDRDELRPGPAPGSPAARAEAEAEI